MSELRFASLETIADITMGQSPAGDTTNSEGVGMPLLNGPTEFRQVNPLPCQWTSQAARLASGGDVLFCVRGSTTGRMNTADQSYAIGRGLAAIRGKQAGDTPFIRYAITFTLPQLLAKATGSTFPNLSRGDIGQQLIPVPAPETRRAIAEVLGALDDKIAANAKVAATADELLATRFESIVGATSNMVRLSELADVNRSTVKPSPDGQLRYIDIASVEVGSYKFPSATPWADAPSRARRGICKGDTLWSTVRPNRRSHALNLSNDPLLVASTGLAVLTARTVGWAYLYEVTRRPEFTSYLETVAEGSAYPAVRADKFGEALVPLANQASQRSFEQLAEPLREELHSLEQENQALAATRDTLLPQLMSGKLRVKDAEKVLENAGV